MRRDGFFKAKRNVADTLLSAQDATVVGVRVADRDRHVFVDLEEGRSLQITPFGPRPNVFLVDHDGAVVDAFLRREEVVGQKAPVPRTAEIPEDERSFAAEWQRNAKTVEAALAAIARTFDRTIVRETLFRADLSASGSADLTSDALKRLWTTFRQINHELHNPEPRIYETGSDLIFSLVGLTHLGETSSHHFESVDEAVSYFVRRSLAERAFRTRYEPLLQAILAEEKRLEASVDQMEQRASDPSRADRYERIGHVLMALQNDVPASADHVVLQDVFDPANNIEIDLDPSQSAVENAEAYYARARQSRAAAHHSERRLADMKLRLNETRDALAELGKATRTRDLIEFEERHGALLSGLKSARSDEATSRFRTFTVYGGFPVLVGRNAAQNDALTFKLASPHDYWLHARGAPGSHVILRVSGRQQEAPARALEEAASIAAHFSKASGSGLVPVTVTRRKYVRKARGAPPGSVHVEREEVLIVPPSLPDETVDSE